MNTGIIILQRDIHPLDKATEPTGIKSPEEILASHCEYDKEYLSLGDEAQIIRPSEAIAAMKEYAAQFQPILPDDPYPEDIFPPLTQEQFNTIAEHCKQQGFLIDRLSAHIGRILYRGLYEKFKSEKQEVIPDDLNKWIEDEAEKRAGLMHLCDMEFESDDEKKSTSTLNRRSGRICILKQ